MPTQPCQILWAQKEAKACFLHSRNLRTRIERKTSRHPGDGCRVIQTQVKETLILVGAIGEGFMEAQTFEQGLEGR